LGEKAHHRSIIAKRTPRNAVTDLTDAIGADAVKMKAVFDCASQFHSCIVNGLRITSIEIEAFLLRELFKPFDRNLITCYLAEQPKL
jgi:hypothetical protein